MPPLNDWNIWETKRRISSFTDWVANYDDALSLNTCYYESSDQGQQKIQRKKNYRKNRGNNKHYNKLLVFMGLMTYLIGIARKVLIFWATLSLILTFDQVTWSSIWVIYSLIAFKFHSKRSQSQNFEKTETTSLTMWPEYQ